MYGSRSSLPRDGMRGRNRLFTPLCTVLIPEQPCWARKEEITSAMSKGPSLWANRALKRLFMRDFHFSYPGLGRMPVLKLEGKKKKVKICLPPSQIYLFPFDKQWFHFSSHPGFFFLFQTEPKPTWQNPLCSCPYLSNTPSPHPHHHSGNKPLPLPADFSWRGTSQYNSPPTQCTLF